LPRLQGKNVTGKTGVEGRNYWKDVPIDAANMTARGSWSKKGVKIKKEQLKDEKERTGER